MSRDQKPRGQIPEDRRLQAEAGGESCEVGNPGSVGNWLSNNRDCDYFAVKSFMLKCPVVYSFLNP
ncbi:MAG: hypothetical protein E3K36_16005 [Candidatus Brocadia sp.]|nr:hypothetical protein [Candidatus Brocadia sp.]